MEIWHAYSSVGNDHQRSGPWAGEWERSSDPYIRGLGIFVISAGGGGKESVVDEWRREAAEHCWTVALAQCP